MTQTIFAAEPKETRATATPTRDHRGRFVPGNPGGPGNPFGRRVAGLRKAFVYTAVKVDLREIAAKLIELAKQGNVAAARLTLQYTLGRPAETADPDRLEADEWRVTQELAVPEAAYNETSSHMPVGLVNVLVRALQPYKDENFRRRILEILDMGKALQAKAFEKAARAAEARAARAAAAPVESAAAPSPNGGNGAAQPSTDGANGAASPSPNGENGAAKPSPNGESRAARSERAPAHGSNEPSETRGRRPSTNGGNRRHGASEKGFEDEPRADDPVSQWLSDILERMESVPTPRRLVPKGRS